MTIDVPLSIILAAIAFVTLMMPPLIATALTLPARVTFDILDEDEFLSGQSDEFRRLDMQIRSLGFVYMGSSSFSAVGSTASFSIYSLAEADTTAMLTTIKNGQTYTEFSREYTDGTRLDVTNGKGPSPFPTMLYQITARYPDVKAPQDLYEIAKQVGSSLNNREKTVPRNKSDCFRALEDAMAKESDQLADLGYCHKKIDRYGERRLTIKGAYLMTWRCVFFGMILQDRIALRFSKRLLEKA